MAKNAESSQPIRDQAPSQAPNRPVELVAVINSYNRKALLEQAVTSLMEALRKAPFESSVVVFEAGSNDGSKEFLEEWRRRYPGDRLVVVTPHDERASFSDGVNSGCAAAIARFPSCRWLFLYETDNSLEQAEPLGQAISLLSDEPRLAAAGFTVKRHDESVAGYGMRFPSWFSLMAGPNLAGRWNLHCPNDSSWQLKKGIRWRLCDIVFTSPLVIRRQAWEQVGGFDATVFPFSDSDLDWAWRCQESGWGTAVIDSEVVVHDNLQQSSPGSAERVIDFHRSRLRLLKRHRKNRASVLIKPILFLRHGLEAILLACRSVWDPRAKDKLAKRQQMLRSVWTDYS
jgi:GT2 family glycosyltransferase